MTTDIQFRTSKATYQANPDQDYLGGGQTADVYRVASNGQRYALKLLTDRAYEQRSMKSQMKAADRSGARLAVIVGSDEAEFQGNDEGQLLRLAGRGRHVLVDRERVVAARRVEGFGNGQLGRARLRIPQRELRQVAARRLLEGREEVLDGGGIAVVTVEVQVHAAPEGVAADRLVAYLVESVLEPSAVVAPTYRGATIITRTAAK